MHHGKFETPRRQFSPTVWIVLLLAVTAMSLGGVGAYLLHSTEKPVTNTFVTEAIPQISVSDDYKVTVSNTNYPVYLRAAVVVNWKSTNGKTVLATMPVEGTDYTVNTDNTGWKQVGNFYYYETPVSNGTIEAPIVTVNGTKTNYELVADVAVQAIQAVGTVDGGTTPAVENAWGLTP